MKESQPEKGIKKSKQQPLMDRLQAQEPTLGNENTHAADDFGGFPEDAPDMKRFLGCGG